MNTITVNGEEYVKSSDKYQRQLRIVYDKLGEPFLEALKANHAIIAGGAVTSAFSNREINDIDVYFRTFEDMKNCFLAVTAGFENIYLSHTDKSITLCDRETGTVVQFIHFDFFATPEDIFSCFDFTVCMAAIDVETDSVVLHGDFLTDVSARILRFNPGTRFPYISLLRTNKYKEYGYTIGRGQMLSIAMSCSQYPITDWDTAKYQLGGVYGHEIDLQIEEEAEFTEEALHKVLTEISDKRAALPNPDYEGLVKKLDGVS